MFSRISGDFHKIKADLSENFEHLSDKFVKLSANWSENVLELSESVKIASLDYYHLFLDKLNKTDFKNALTLPSWANPLLSQAEEQTFVVETNAEEPVVA